MISKTIAIQMQGVNFWHKHLQILNGCFKFIFLLTSRSLLLFPRSKDLPEQGRTTSHLWSYFKHRRPSVNTTEKDAHPHITEILKFGCMQSITCKGQTADYFQTKKSSDATFIKDACGLARSTACLCAHYSGGREYSPLWISPKECAWVSGFTRDSLSAQKRTSPLFSTSKTSKNARVVPPVFFPMLQYSQGELLGDFWPFLKPLCHSYTTQ